MRWVLDISSVVLGRGLRSVTTHNALPRTVTRSLSSSLLVTPNRPLIRRVVRRRARGARGDARRDDDDEDDDDDDDDDETTLFFNSFVRAFDASCDRAP